MSNNTVILEPTYNNVEITKKDNQVSVSYDTNNVVVEPVYYNVEVLKEENQVVISSSGPQGPTGSTGATGQQGPQGPQGISGSAAGSFRFEQQTELSVWTITHNLDYRPAITVQDYGQNTLEGSVQYIDGTAVIITFSVPVSGYAYLS